MKDRWEHNGVVYVDAHEIIKELEKENKNLNEKIELLDNENMCLNAEIKDREKENKNLKSDLADHHKREIDDATDYVILFRKWVIASTLLLISLIMNFILIIW